MLRLRWLLATSLVLAWGCAPDAKRRSAAPAAGSAPWIDDAALLGEGVDAVPLDSLAGAVPAARVVRLDRLIDMFDAARFAEDEYAREALWSALGGHSTGIGAEATRDATRRLLQEALAIEAAAQSAGQADVVLGADRRAFVSDAIMMLSVDLELPATAEELSIRTLAYRTLTEQGHPRIVDNARWRLYDHVRGILQGAAEVSPERRMDVAVQAVYAERDRVDAFLADAAPHARPAWPTPEQLWSLLERHRTALARIPRWEPVIAARERADGDLRETVMTVLPASRDTTWPMPTTAPGTGREESLAPVVQVNDGSATVDAGRPQARTVALGDDVEDLARALRGALSQDGRGALLLAADPRLPSPQLQAVFRGIRRAQASRVELAVREPRVGDDGSDIVVALPLEVGRDSDRTAGVRAMLQARIHVHLTGRGPRFAIDGRSLPTVVTTPRQLGQLVDTLSRAYPRERIVRVTLTSDVMLQQLVELLIALEGGPRRRFSAVGWHAGGGPPAEVPGDPGKGHERILHARADAYWPEPTVELEQPFPLHDTDQKRLEAFAESLNACIPELETAAPEKIRIGLAFAEGRLVEAHPPEPGRVPPDRIEALRTCIDDVALSFRLRQHRDRLAITVTLSAGSSS